ncbi:MAG TPA: XRE family transcriptional regulator [Myxococcota bacterium]|nr:XRE family transcriptional regulator [Myxococcota bacterium]
MAKSFNLLRAKMTSENRKKAQEETKRLLREMPMNELRQARQMSQERLAEMLGKKQANVSKIEHRTDMYISTLRSYIEAMGGQLKIVAHFPDGDIVINQFQEIGEKKVKAA